VLSGDATLFISDLHLCVSRPHITGLLLKFLQGPAREARALYVLGDLFEYWAGDDDLADPYHAQICTAFRQVADSGVPVALIHGNRDFLLGEAFAHASGMAILTDPTLLEMHGRRVLLTHGDELCTDDVEYQKFRVQVRDSRWQEAFMAQPLAARKAQIEALRMRSESEKSHKSEAIMDVNAEAVIALVERFDHPDLLIHGHTHRPGMHEILIDGKRTERHVLADWYEAGSYLQLTDRGCEALSIA
jgi:UDP-2,3-diacylglucosamine hydrolase